MAAIFMLMLVGGLGLALAAAPLQLIAWRYLRLAGMLVLALGSGAAAWFLYTGGWRAGGAARWAGALNVACALAAAAWVMTARLDFRVGRLRLIVACVACTGLAAVVVSMPAVEPFDAVPLVASVGGVVGVLSGAWLLGAVTAAWLLGHAYLTATRMTFAPLRQLVRQLSMALALRIALILAGAFMLWRSSDGSGHSAFANLAHNWLIASLRAALGLIALPIFAYMIADCVKRRATQAATGILYFASVFTYISELCGLYLLREVCWPL